MCANLLCCGYLSGSHYADCIFEGVNPRYSRIEKYYVFLHLRSIPQADADICPYLFERLDKCNSTKAVNPHWLIHDWNERLYDDFYVSFLMRLGSLTCRNSNKALKLQSCVTLELETALQNCTRTDHGFDYQCIKDTYELGNNCPPNIDSFFLRLLKLLAKNPYSRKPGLSHA